MLDPDSYYQNGHELMKEKLITSSLALQDKGLQSQMPSLSLRQHSMFVLIKGVNSEIPGVELREPREKLLN
mgnify:CR=1 FL=1